MFDLDPTVFESTPLPQLSEEVIFLVLLISWMGVCDNDGYQVIEYFAGVAEIARLAKGSEGKAAERDSLRIHTVGIEGSLAIS